MDELKELQKEIISIHVKFRRGIKEIYINTEVLNKILDHPGMKTNIPAENIDKIMGIPITRNDSIDKWELIF